MAQQLVNDPEDPFLATSEYEFLYKFYKGLWHRYVETEDIIFIDVWDYINRQDPKSTFFHKNCPILEQVYTLGDVDYRALWMNCLKTVDTIEGPPDVITWSYPMLSPTNVQQLLF